MQKSHFLATTFLIPTLMFGMCTSEEKAEMKGNGYSVNQISDICSENTTSELDQDSQTIKKGAYTALRVGYKSTSGTYTVERPGYTTYQGEKAKESGLEISFAPGSNRGKGFDWRPVLTLQFTSGQLDDNVDTSTILFLGEFEFAYNFNQYFSAFVGFNGGIGSETFTISSINYDESVTTAQLGAFIGISGDFNDNIGYFLKISALTRNHAATSYDEYITQFLSDTTIGLSYKF